MGFYAPAQLVTDARQHGVEVLPADVGFSDWETTLTRTHAGATSTTRCAIRLGLHMIRGLPQDVGQLVVACRESGPYVDVADFTRRTRLGQATITRLADCRCLGIALGRSSSRLLASTGSRSTRHSQAVAGISGG